MADAFRVTFDDTNKVTDVEVLPGGDHASWFWLAARPLHGVTQADCPILFIKTAGSRHPRIKTADGRLFYWDGLP